VLVDVFLVIIVEGCMKRREFITLIGATAATWPLMARAQQPKIARIGWMARGNSTTVDPNIDAFRQGMRELGYVEGQSFVMESRYGDGKPELMPGQAAELERIGVDVIVAGPFEALQAAKQSTSRVPIIMTTGSDPIVTGMVASFDHPEGRITGITEMMPELGPQRLKLLAQIVPSLSRVAIMWRPGTLSQDTFRQMLENTQVTARSVGVQIQLVEEFDDFDGAFSAMAKERADGLIVLVNPMYSVQRNQIIERAMKQRLPAIHEWKLFAQAGGLITYGADIPDIYRRAAGFADKILKGAKPADLPVEMPIRIEMAVNLKSAKAIGVTVPDSILKEAVQIS
jgi:putative tryptophan/tyrosine transport system substrate-binding protein